MDKFLHLFVGFTIAATMRSAGINRTVAFGMTVSVGVGKEVYDAQGHGTPEVLDAVATTAGGLLGAWAVDPNSRQEYRDTHKAPRWTPNAFALAQVDSVARCLHVAPRALDWSLTGPDAHRLEGYTVKRHVFVGDTLSASLIRHEATHALTGVMHGDRRETAVFVARCQNWPLR